MEKEYVFKKNGSRAIGNPHGGEKKQPLPLYLTPYTHTHKFAMHHRPTFKCTKRKKKGKLDHKNVDILLFRRHH